MHHPTLIKSFFRKHFKVRAACWWTFLVLISNGDSKIFWLKCANIFKRLYLKYEWISFQVLSVNSSIMLRKLVTKKMDDGGVSTELLPLSSDMDERGSMRGRDRKISTVDRKVSTAAMPSTSNGPPSLGNTANGAPGLNIRFLTDFLNRTIYKFSKIQNRKIKGLWKTGRPRKT